MEGTVVPAGSISLRRLIMETGGALEHLLLVDVGQQLKEGRG